MTVDQNVTRPAPDRGEMSSCCGFLAAGEIDEALGGEAADHPDIVPGSLRPAAAPAWPRVYPGL